MDLKDRMTVIAMSDLFQGAPDFLVEKVAELATEEEAPAGSILMEHDVPGDRVRLIVRGKCAICADVDGLELVVAVLEPGNWLHVSALATGRRAPSSRVRAMAPTTLWSFDAAAVRSLLEEDPRAGMAVMARAAKALGDYYGLLMKAIRRNLQEQWEGLAKQRRGPEHQAGPDSSAAPP